MSDNFSNLPNNNNVVDLTGDTSSGSDTEPEPEHVPAVIHHVPVVIDISSGSEAEIVPAPVPNVNFWALANPNPVPIDHFWGSSSSESSGSDWSVGNLQPLPNHEPAGAETESDASESLGESDTDSTASLGSFGDADSEVNMGFAMADYVESESDLSLDSDESEFSYDSDDSDEAVAPVLDYDPQLRDFCGEENDPERYD
jgi:hypothetical protein